MTMTSTYKIATFYGGPADGKELSVQLDQFGEPEAYVMIRQSPLRYSASPSHFEYTLRLASIDSAILEYEFRTER